MLSPLIHLLSASGRSRQATSLYARFPRYPISFFLFLLFAIPARAVDISTHSFAGCGFPDTGQTLCYNGTSSPVACTGTGTDGDYSVGSSSPNYTVYAGSVTVDNRTGLMWESTGSNNGNKVEWADALAICEASTFAGYSDWRLPNVRELMSIAHYGRYNPAADPTAFPGTLNSGYWTSTTYRPNTAQAWYVEFQYGVADASFKVSVTTRYVRCVRGGPGAAMVPTSAVSAHAFNSGMNCYSIWRLPDTSTGTVSYGTGDDTAYQPAVSSPSYTNNGNGTTTDNVTGLMWVSNSGSDIYTWEAAISSCVATTAGGLNSGSGYAGYKDWRLPNVRELQSIITYNAYQPSVNPAAFPNTTVDPYWTSTTMASANLRAWIVSFNTGSVSNSGGQKTYEYNVRCVRGP